MNHDYTCPKCQAPMRSYERNGVSIEQCTECRGIFLDRGELEHLIDAETRQQPMKADSQTVRSGEKPKKRRSFLEDLFE